MHEDALVREILQSRLLAAIFSRSVRREVVLKGGLALRSAYQSFRSTKDIDLGQSASIPLQRLQTLMRAAIKEAMSTGLLRGVQIT